MHVFEDGNWLPRIKPWPPNRIEYDPGGLLSRGLQTLLLFENTAQASGWRDYASPTQTFSFNGAVVPTIGSSPFGGLSFFNNESAGATDILLGTPLASTATWSISSLVKFNGAKPTAGHSAGIAGDQGFTHTPSIDDVSGQWDDQQNSGAGKCGTNVATWTTWTRVHLTEDGTTFRVYINGALDGSNAQAMTFAQGILFFNWIWPQADFFYWNRTLTATDVTAHFSDPYGTTMRPKPAVSRLTTTSFNADPLGTQPPSRVEMIGY